MSHLTGLLADSLLAAGLVAALVVGGAAWLLRRARRRLRGLGWTVTAALAGAAAGRRAAPAGWAAQPWTSPHWWRLRSGRRRMWQAVRGAEQAGAAARAADAPVGDLPALVRTLQRVARQADAALRADAAAGPAAGVGRPAAGAADVVAAARTIHAAAMQALDGAVAPPAAELRQAAGLECQALAAGLAQWHRLAGGRPTGRP